MQLQEFNIESVMPIYGYKLSPVNERSYLIVKKGDLAKEPVPVGDYTVLDKEEDPSLTEKKIMNLIALLNGRQQLMDLGHLTKSRVLYHVVNDGQNGEDAKVIFYHLGKKGVSKENALFRFKNEGVL